jgi:hypothetical protein
MKTINSHNSYKTIHHARTCELLANQTCLPHSVLFLVHRQLHLHLPYDTCMLCTYCVNRNEYMYGIHIWHSIMQYNTLATLTFYHSYTYRYYTLLYSTHFPTLLSNYPYSTYHSILHILLTQHLLQYTLVHKMHYSRNIHFAAHSILYRLDSY